MSNLPIAGRISAALVGFAIACLDGTHPNGVSKGALVAHLGSRESGVAFAAHTDTFPPNGWTWDPFQPAIEDGFLRGLGAVDKKGPLAAAIVAAHVAPADLPLTLLLTSTRTRRRMARG